ncbi:MAG: hypothetical protein AMXMBFR64_18230 [Myxococcales bacterium]
MRRLAALAATLLVSTAQAGVEKYGDQFKNGDIGLDKVPHFGKSRVLVVPVEFGMTADFAHLDTFFDNSDGAKYSFRKYWQINSYGAFDVTVDVLPVVHFDSCPAPNNPKCEFTPQNGFSAIEAVRAVFERLDGELGVDFTKYDTNGPDGKPDGFCDGIIFLVPNYTGGIAPPIYPFLKDEDGKPANVWDGVTVGAIAISNTDAETILHEFGHLLGFADLYNFDLRFSMMSWCSDCMLDAQSRLKIGWAEALDVPPGELMDVLLRPATSSKQVVRVMGADPKEYFLLEMRREATFGNSTVDVGLDGVAVYHVDENKEAPIIAQSNYPPWHPLIMNERPTNNQAEPRLFRPGDEFLPNYTGDQQSAAKAKTVYWNSNWYDGSYSGIRIDQVREVDEDGPAYRVRVRGVTPYEPPVVTPDEDAGPTQPDAGPAQGDTGGADTTADVASGDAPGADTAPAGGAGEGCGTGAPVAWLALLVVVSWLRRRSAV